MYNTNYFLYVPKVCCKCLDTAHKTISLTSNSRPLLITPEIKYKTIEGIALCKKHYIRLTISRILGAALIIIALIMANTITIDPFQHPSRGWIFYT